MAEEKKHWYILRTISGKEMKVKEMIDWNGYKDEKHLHNKVVQTIKENLEKKRANSTSESINFIKEELDKAYESGLHYERKIS